MSRKILIIIIVPTALLALFGWLGVYGLQGEEPRRALISIEMLKDGDLIKIGNTWIRISFGQ